MKKIFLVLALMQGTFLYGQKVINEDIYITRQEQIDEFDYDVVNGSVYIAPPSPYNNPRCISSGCEGTSCIPCTPIYNLAGLAGVKINGTLLIGGNRSLTSLAGLKNVEVIGGITIYNNPLLQDLTGLGNITINDRGSFSISRNAELRSFKGIESVKFAPGADLKITESSALVDLRGLTNIKISSESRLGPAQILIENNANLKNLDGVTNVQIGLGSLLRVKNNPSLSSMEGINGFSFLGSGGVVIEDNAGLKTLLGLRDMKFSGSGVTLSINNNTSLVNLTGMENIEFRGNWGTLKISANASLVDLTGAKNLLLGGFNNSMVIENNPALQTLTGLNFISFVDSTSLIIRNNNKLTDLRGLTYDQVNGDLSVINNASLVSLEGIANTRSQEVIIENNPKLSSLKGMDSFKTDRLLVHKNPVLRELSGLHNADIETCQIQSNPELTKLTGLGRIPVSSFIIMDNSQLTSLEGISAVQFKEKAKLSITRNNALTNLKGLKDLRFSSGEINIINNASLKDLEGIENVNMDGGIFHIENNPALTSLKGISDAGSSLSRVRINANQSIVDMTGAEGLKCQGLSLLNNPVLTSLKGLDGVDVANLEINGNPLLRNLEGIKDSKISFFTMRYLDALASLKGIQSTVSFGVILGNNKNLMDIEDLREMKIHRVTIIDNPKLSECCAINNVLQTTVSGAVSTIERNKTGCNSKDEVVTECTIRLDIFNDPPLSALQDKKASLWNSYDIERPTHAVRLGTFVHDQKDKPEIFIPADGTTSTLLYMEHENVANLELRIDLTNWTGETVQLQKGKVEKGIVTYRLTHPASGQFSSYSKPLKFFINRYSNNNTERIGEFVFHVIRPPVLMLHGRAADRESFNALEKHLLESGRYQKHQLYRANYKETNLNSFERNQHVVFNGIRSLYRSSIANKVSFGEVDIIGHSMGGLLARKYISSEKFQLLRNVNKLISLNTPHSGSHLAHANYLLMQLIGLLKLFDNNVSQFGAADYDLRLDSDEIKKLIMLSESPADDVPALAITTTFDTSDPTMYDTGARKYISIFNFLQWLSVDAAAYPVQELPNAFFADFNDLVVSETSQEGGLARVNTVELLDDHSSTDNTTVIDALDGLLDLPASDKKFSQTGFHPREALKSTMQLTMLDKLTSTLEQLKKFGKAQISGRKAETSGPTLEKFISMSTDRNNITAGEHANISFTVSESVDYYMFFSSELFLTADSVRHREFTLTYTSNENTVGDVNFAVLAFRKGELVAVENMFTIKIDPKADLSAVLFGQENFSIAEKDTVTALIYGDYTDDVQRDITLVLPENAVVSKFKRAAYVKGQLIGLKKGSDILYVSYQGLIDTAYVEIAALTPSPTTPPYLGFMYSDSVINYGEAIYFKGISTLENTMWEWRFTGSLSPTSNERELMVTYPTPGLYDVELRISGDSTTTMVRKDLVRVSDCPGKPLISFEGESAICPDQSLILSGPDVKGNFIWSTGETTRKISVTRAGYYSVKIKSPTGCESPPSDTIVVFLRPAFPAALRHDNDTLFSSGGLRYEWYKEGILLAEEGNTFYPVETGAYQVKNFNLFGCSSLSEVIRLDVVTGIEDNAAWKQLNLFPNPSHHTIHLKIENQYIGEVRIILLNLLGGVQKRTFASKKSETLNVDVDIRDFADGVYLMRIELGEQSFYKRVVIVH